MNQALTSHWGKLLLDTDALLVALHGAYGSWDRVQDFLVGAVASHSSRESVEDELLDPDFEAELLAAELSWKGRSYE